MIKNLVLTQAPPTSLRARFGSGFLFSLVAAVFNGGSTFLVNIVVANLLGRQIFGEFAIVQNTLLTLSTVASLGTGFTATKYVAEFRSVDKLKTGRIVGLCSALSLAMGILFTVALLASSPWLAATVLKASHLSRGLMLTAAVIFFNVNNFYQTGVLAGLESYPAIAKAGVIAGTTYFALCATGAYFWGREGALAGLTVSTGVQCLALRFYSRRECARHGIVPDYRGMTKERSVFFKFALPAALSGFSFMPAVWLSNTFLARQAGGYIQVALYAAASNLRVLVLFLPQLFNSVGMSLLNNARGVGDARRYRRIFWGNLLATALVTLVGAIGITFLGPALLTFFGRDFGEGYPVLLVLMASTLIEALMLATYQIIQSQGRMWLSLFAVALPRDATLVILAYLLTSAYGAVGLALGYAAGWGLALMFTIIVVILPAKGSVTPQK